MPRAALPYEEPQLVDLLVIASFLYLLNVIRVVADYLLHAGIIAEITFSIIYGFPVANLLPIEWEATFTALGYLGLVLVVFEGGLSTNLPVLLSNLPLSIVCALTGISIPIGFSFALLNAGFGYKPLEAFAAGAALSSTSLGTALAALNSITRNRGATPAEKQPTHIASSIPSSPHQLPLQQTRIGTVLISAAIIDDVIGLVIASLIPALASVDPDSHGTSHGHLAWTVVRPLLSSFLIAVGASVIARFILRPAFWHCGTGERWCAPAREGKAWGACAFAREGSGWGTTAHADAVKLLAMVAVVSGMAAIANCQYIRSHASSSWNLVLYSTDTDTSVLYGAYLAGLILTYICQPPTGQRSSETARELSCDKTFARTVGPLQGHLFLPLFFASIGFAIPFLDLWHPTVIWRGILYSVLMCLAKLAVGLPILVYPVTLSLIRTTAYKLQELTHKTRSGGSRSLQSMATRISRSGRQPMGRTPTLPHTCPKSAIQEDEKIDSLRHGSLLENLDETSLGQAAASIPAATFMGIAMVSRGEIGLLIAQLARGNGSGETPGLLGDEAFLVCIWAILLCTLVGPIGTGVAVRFWGSRLASGLWV
ncbi:hypothetical protein BD310DRAFT_213478 [Dichomitus squalens]|uniref:Cation/H+ exchanger transmembrane domain-containing protein n=1 Tax=Dichomitus squalens TaxID=114155 RepID=A0A4Q9Q1X6_9APHY|nr:hypothetical protein BD310DRAFT_213478 [Dichomitus squalens]